MEQPNQQTIQQDKVSKSPIKTNSKYIAVVVVFAVLVVGGILLLKTIQTPPTSPQDQIQRTPLVKVYTHGGLCPTGECRSQVVINSDGTFVYIPDLNIESEQNTRIEGSIGTQKILSLTQAIKQSDFQKIKGKKFVEECPTAYDGSETIYTFYVGSVVEEIASCTIAIDHTSSPFRVLDEIIDTGIINRTQKEQDEEGIFDTSTWQTYRNSEFGFEVRYPGDWLYEKDNLANFFFPPEMKGNRQGSIVVSVIDKANLPPPIDLNIKRQAYDISHLKTLRAIKWKGEEVSIKEMGSAYEQYVAQIENESYIFRFSFQNSLDRKYDAVFDQILSTFRFMPTPKPVSTRVAKEITVTAKKNQWRFVPEEFEVNQEDKVVLTVVNEDDYDHGFAIDQFGISERIPANNIIKVEFMATQAGDFPFYSSVPSGGGIVDGKKRTYYDMVGNIHVRSLIPETK